LKLIDTPLGSPEKHKDKNNVHLN